MIRHDVLDSFSQRFIVGILGNCVFAVNKLQQPLLMLVNLGEIRIRIGTDGLELTNHSFKVIA